MDQTPSISKNAIQENLNLSAEKCLVTHAEANVVYGHNFDVFYNSINEPDSISWYGTLPIKIRYNSKGLLTKVNFGTDGVHYDFIYKKNTALPAAINFYYPSFINTVNGLIAVFKFTYNAKGQIVKIITDNLLNKPNSAEEVYQYDRNDNVVKVTYSPANGTAFNENEVTGYDSKPNFMGGTKWLKFILYNSGTDYYYYFRMFSKNNSLEWNIDFGDGFKYPLSAIYDYNIYGFANYANIQLFGEDFGYESATSTCDATAARQQSMPFTQVRKDIQFKNLTGLPTTIKK
jgi:hypothetical protein